MEGGRKEFGCNLPPCTFYNDRGGYLGYLTPPQARYFNVVILWVKENYKVGETGTKSVCWIEKYRADKVSDVPTLGRLIKLVQ